MVIMKGYVRMLEILLSLSIIVVAMVFVFRFTPYVIQNDMNLIKDRAFNALEFMDQNGDLRKIAFNSNRNALNNNLTLLLTGLEFEADVCNNDCFTPILPNKPITSIEYYVSGYQDKYKASKIKLWVWRKF